MPKPSSESNLVMLLYFQFVTDNLTVEPILSGVAGMRDITLCSGFSHAWIVDLGSVPDFELEAIWLR